jgi:glucosamine--fructose-6-phosphate aminotransferase (isomerizing)
MCGIVGYVGNRHAGTVLFHCLEKLEYRGYDSCGVAVKDDNRLQVFKDKLRVAELAQIAPSLNGMAGIGHTRWATCGEPSKENAHPHWDCHQQIVVVHNGIIGNYQDIKRKLAAEGHIFTSGTDTEIIPHLIEKYYKGNLKVAVAEALNEIDGSYAIAVMMAGEANLVVARKDSPLVIGVGDDEFFAASDVTALLDYTNRVVYLQDGDIGVLTAAGFKIIRGGVEVEAVIEQVDWGVEEARRGGYPHFMLKEIHEQPRVVRDTLVSYAQISNSNTERWGLFERSENIMMLACGTSYHAALLGKYIFEEFPGTKVNTELASEFNYYSQPPKTDLALAITQSGETADTLRATRRLRGAGCRVVAITNVVGSTISRIASDVIYTNAGPEISVAATKTFMAELVALYWLGLKCLPMDTRRQSAMLLDLRQMPSKIQHVLDNPVVIKEQAHFLANHTSVIFMGRGINYPIALEGALKLKEISYIHAEGYAAGELKHGPFALLDESTPVVAILTLDNTHDAMLNNIREVKARRSPVIVLADERDNSMFDIADAVIKIPHAPPLFSPLVNLVALQLLAYYTALEKGCPIDFPRNLAKSVTVE